MRRVTRIKELVANHYKVGLRSIESQDRSRSISLPRQVAMRLTREFTRLSFPEIGREFNRDHTTVMHAVRVIGEREEWDSRLRENLVQLRMKLNEELN